jgi:hypothetical protein
VRERRDDGKKGWNRGERSEEGVRRRWRDRKRKVLKEGAMR